MYKNKLSHKFMHRANKTNLTLIGHVVPIQAHPNIPFEIDNLLAKLKE